MHDYAGAIHFHSNYSFDGNTGIEAILDAARRQKLDFLVLTDHFRIDAKRDGWEGWHDGVLLIVGEEISPRHNHYLALNVDEPVIAWKKQAKPQEYIDAVNEQGGFGLIAHPDHTGARRFGVKSYEWNDWSVTGYTGMSIWDLMTDWQEKLTSPLSGIKAYLSPAWSLTGPKEVTLQRWDALNQDGRVFGFGEIDNHNTRKRLWGRSFHIFPFEDAFATIRTHLFTDIPLSSDAETAKQQVYAAMRHCQSYVAQERWRSAQGFQFSVGSTHIGGETRLTGESIADIRVPSPGVIRLICNGKMVARQNGQSLRYQIREPGVYRVEVFQKQWGLLKPWIFSNPVWVRKV